MKRSLLAGFAVLITGIILFLGSCVQDTPDAPPSNTIPFDPNKVYTIQDLKTLKDTTGGYTFTDDYSVFATVTADEKSGNLYKTVFVQDATGGIQLNFFNPGGVYLGDSIRINLNGSTVDDYGALYQINNLDQGKNIYKIATGKIIEPELVTIEELTANLDKYQSTLIRLDSVQFQEAELGNTYADSVNKIDENRMLENCDQVSIIVRTSGYADFANRIVAQGKGSFIAISTRYNDLAQLVIRNIDDINLTANRCGGGGGGEPIDPVASVEEFFNSAVAYTDISIEGWTNIFVQGDRKWQGKTFQTEKYVQATGYNSGLTNMETWLITPPVINTTGDKKLTFKCAQAYWEHTINEPITVMASLDFDGTNFSTATWTALQANLPTSSNANYEWVESGEVSLASFVGNVAIGFKYVGSDTESTSIELDDVMVNTGGGVNPGILSANFNSSWNNFETISVTGAQVWDRDNTYGPDFTPCAQMSGYENGSFANEDWLISPAVDLTGYTSVILTFETAKNYTGNNLEVKISTDYSGDPSSAVWTDLQATLSPGNNNWEWIPSGDVDLSSYAGQTVYVGFKYTSTASASATWEVDNVLIEGE